MWGFWFSLMKQIPLATKSLRHKDTQSKENQLNKLSVRQLTDSDFVTPEKSGCSICGEIIFF